MSSTSPVHVFKFGGTSVATADRIRRVVHLIASSSPHARRIVVVSALGGVTNQLIDGINLSLKRSDDRIALIDSLRRRHAEVARELIDNDEQQAILVRLNKLWHDLQELLDGVALLRECSPRSRDVVISMGERASAPLIAAAFRAEGLQAVAMDADEFVRTDDIFGEATVDFPTTNRLIRDAFRDVPDDSVAIVTGFVGSTDRGVITTLGRSGSDYTATILGGALNAEKVEIWTDVDGVLSADPRMVMDAVSLPQLSYREASELAYFGAKVLHPRTMRPLMEHSIPLYIKNTLNPEAPGTLIWDRPVPAPRVIKGVTAIREMAMVVIEGTGMMGVPGIAARAFGALAARKINVLLISQASSEQSICVVVKANCRAEAVEALEEVFDREIGRGDIFGVSATDDTAIVSVVGEGMRTQTGLTGRMFAALGRVGVNVLCVAEGASDTNISAVVAEQDVERGLDALHEAFVTGRDRVHLFLIGAGIVGRRLLSILARQEEVLKARVNLKIKLVGLATSRSMVWDREGIPFDEAIERLDSARPTDLESIVEHIEAAPLERLIVVDATASDDIARYYPRLLTAGASVVTPNKRANSLEFSYFQQLQDLARTKGVAYRYETTVGAGLPILSTIRDLVLAGDRIHRVEGVLSGTLAFVCNRLSEGAPFGQAIREAHLRGFTEPDPREDLAGRDVARKILIVAREMGMPAEPEEVHVESLLDVPALEMDVDTFMARLDDFNPAWDRRLEEATASGGVLRYVATASASELRVGLKICPPTSPFAGMAGTENVVVITSDRYPEESPLVIRGAGAGPDVTAAGIMGDLIRAAQTSG